MIDIFHNDFTQNVLFAGKYRILMHGDDVWFHCDRHYVNEGQWRNWSQRPNNMIRKRGEYSLQKAYVIEP